MTGGPARRRPLLSGEQKGAIALLLVLLAGGALFIKDQLDFCGVRCSTAVEDPSGLNRLARMQGIARMQVPDCAGAGGVAAVAGWAAPGPVSALTTAPDGRLFAAGSDGVVWTAPPASPEQPVPRWARWAPAGEPVDAGGRVTALATVTAPAQLLVATGDPARVQALDLSGGQVRGSWDLPDGSQVRALAGGGNRLVVVDSGSGAVFDASVVGQDTGTWGPLRSVRGPGELAGAGNALAGSSAGRPIALLADPEQLRLFDSRAGSVRLLVGGGPGVDAPMTADAPAAVHAAAVARVGDQVVLVDAERVRPAVLREDWRGVGVGAATQAPGLAEPLAATGWGQHLVVADGSERLAAVVAPTCR